MKSKTKFLLMVIAMIFGLHSCDDSKVTVNSNDFNFTAVNLTVDEGKLTAFGGNIKVTANWTATVVTINGETTMVGGIKVSDELPVRAGDEIEIQFTSSCSEETEAYFTLPDGTSQKATVKNPSFKWTVPDNFTSGMQIKGKTHYETEDCIFNRTGIITLVELK